MKMIDYDDVIEAPVDEGVPWTARDAWWGVFSLGLWLGATYLMVVAADMFGWQPDFTFFLAVGELSLMIPVWWFVFRKYEVDWSALGFRPFTESLAKIGCGALVIYYSFMLCYMTWIANMGIESEDNISLLVGEPGLLSGFAISAVLIAPFVEEIFFRGFLFTGFREKYGWKIAAVLSASMFALIHLQGVNFLPIFVLGLLFATVYQITKSIWPAIILHAAVNMFSILLVYVFVLIGG